VSIGTEMLKGGPLLPGPLLSMPALIRPIRIPSAMALVYTHFRFL